MFIYPKFDKDGKKTVTRTYGKTASMLQDITVYKLDASESLELLTPGMETAVLLLEGNVTLYYGDESFTAERESVFSAPPVCLHVPKDYEIKIVAEKNSEILVQSTENDRDFTPVIYNENNIYRFTSCKDKWDNTAVRDVTDIITVKNSPYSNMVLGEVLARQGRWWSYIPHNHPQPEVYYYKMHRPEGFGACFIGEKAYTVKDGSAGLFDGGYTHVQVTAPGYPMYCAWMIRHLPGDPWDNTRTDDSRYTWLLED